MTGWKYLSQNRRPKDPRRIVVERQRYGPNWMKQRKACLERDGYQCVRCHHQGKLQTNGFWDVSAHHVRKIKFFVVGGIFDWKSANDLSNLITLCELGCHQSADGHRALRGFVALK